MSTTADSHMHGIYFQPGFGGVKELPSDPDQAQPAEAVAAPGARPCTPPGISRPPTPSEELVCRGIWLILDGMLDGHTEEELAAQLSVSSRHLSRLFLEHVGVTPDGLARSVRAHFARRLLDDTDLSMMDVAFAAGYTSLRQFNRACKETFHETPRALRSRRRDPDRLVADGGLLLRLPYGGPLDWDATLAHLADRAIPGVEAIDGSVYRRTMVCMDDAGVIELMPGCEGHLLLRAHLPHLPHLMQIVRCARQLANLDYPIEEATTALAAIPSLAALVAARPGVRPPGSWNSFEMGVYSILAERRSLRDAAAAAGRIVDRYGTPVPGLMQLGLSHVFPASSKLADADLEGLGLTKLERDALRAFAQAVKSGKLSLNRSMRLDDFLAAVTALPGVGTLIAHYLALRIGEPDACPVSDTSTAFAIANEVRPFRALAAMHLTMAQCPEHSHQSAA